MTGDSTTTTPPTMVPTRWIGPIRLSGGEVNGQVEVPLATFESPLWPSVGRGARISRLVPDERGIRAEVLGDCMTRSVILRTDDVTTAANVARRIRTNFHELELVVSDSSRFARLDEIHTEVVGPLLFVRFQFTTGDASGHNMTTLASDRLIEHLLMRYPLTYGSISGNMCVDKKNSSINGILGRGKSVTADIIIPADIVSQQLRTTAAHIARLNQEKNYIGSILAGGVRTANAHYANMLLAFYLATGQDAANIVEGSQGVTYAEDRDGALYFSCSLPNLIVGTQGNGKDLPQVREALDRLGCGAGQETGTTSRRLAVICAATVLCGELSLLAAQTNPGELMQSHLALERNGVHV
jgi:hydroxymethylglutaryl-CoA reductase (NADPH)